MKARQTLLFLCTGNFYRSRYAEAYFNHQASNLDLLWTAESRGFRPHLAQEDFSHLAAKRLSELEIPFSIAGKKPTRVELNDLTEASLVVALYESEHRPMFQSQFPEWLERVRYWNIPDIDEAPSEVALPMIESEVDRLVRSLHSGHALGVLEDVLVEF